MRFLRKRLSGGKRTLYLLATSNIPDPYVNVLVHALNVHRPEKIIFVEVVEVTDDENEAVEHVRSVYSNVEMMLQELSQGRYLNRSSTGNAEDSIPESASRVYGKCLASFSKIETGVVTVPWSDLDKKIGEFISAGGAMFDVTTLKKNLLVEVASILLSRGCLDFYTFELTAKRRFFDHRDLIHNLDTISFRYRRVSDSRHIDTARRRLVSRSTSMRRVLIVNVCVCAVVLSVQLLFPASWADKALIAVATAASIAAMFLVSAGKDSS